MSVQIATATYRAIRERLKVEDPRIDEQTLADTVEGLTDLHEILSKIVRGALSDEALAVGLKSLISDMEGRLLRLQDRAGKRREIVREAMLAADLKKIIAPDFTASVREGLPSLLVLDEKAVPTIYWQPREPKLKRQELLADLKQGAQVQGVALSNSEPVLSVRTR